LGPRVRIPSPATFWSLIIIFGFLFHDISNADCSSHMITDYVLYVLACCKLFAWPRLGACDIHLDQRPFCCITAPQGRIIRLRTLLCLAYQVLCQISIPSSLLYTTSRHMNKTKPPLETSPCHATKVVVAMLACMACQVDVGRRRHVRCPQHR
jgi:hypothetical protein